MKKILMVLFIGIILAGCSSMRKVDTADLQIQRVVVVPTLTKNELFDKSRMWYATAFKSANHVIQYENKENGTIMGNGVLNNPTRSFGQPPLEFSLSTEVKDNKARITAIGQGYIDGRIWSNYKPIIEDMLLEYEQYIKGPALIPKSDNW